jgi:hypothetical protein
MTGRRLASLAAAAALALGAVSFVAPAPAPAGPVQAQLGRTLPELKLDGVSLGDALDFIRDVSGVNLELLGLRDATQSGVLEEHRKQAGMSILAGLFDSLRLYRKRQGRILLYFILTYLSDGRLIRIVGEEGAKYVPLIHQPGLVDYDVVVDDEPTSPNQKEKVWATLMQMLPMLGQTLDASDIATLAEYSPLPTAVVEKWQRKVKEGEAGQAPVRPHKLQLEAMLQKAKVMLTEAQAAKAKADAARTAVEAKAGEAVVADVTGAGGMPPPA